MEEIKSIKRIRFILPERLRNADKNVYKLDLIDKKIGIVEKISQRILQIKKEEDLKDKFGRENPRRVHKL
jgi:hypothetical protein